MRRAAAAALAAVLTTGCATGTTKVPARSVIVEGWAPVGDAPRPLTLRRALADARRRAVEEAGGVEVASVSTVDDAARVRERVSTTARGRVTAFDVLSEETHEGMLKVLVRARVEAPVAGAARRIGWIPGTGPSAAVVTVASDPAAADAVRSAFVAAWTSYGGEAAAEGSAGDLLLRVTAVRRVIDEPRVRPFVSVRVRLTATASSAGGATVWAGARECAALGLDEGQAAERAANDAAEALARAAAEGLPARVWLSARVTER